MPTPSLVLLSALLAPLASALLIVSVGRFMGRAGSLVALVGPLVSFASCFALVGTGAELRAQWAPQLGVDLHFLADPLSVAFGLLVSGLGALITLYAGSYLAGAARRRLLGLLHLFMAVMLATVFSANLLLLFILWELTGVASFFLIGFDHERADAQRGARLALVTTTATGLCLLVGVVMLGQLYGSFSLPELLTAPRPTQDTRLTIALACCLVGVFGKSAILPFHSWLAGAMTAPTPVSAYLHSATLVKLGVFLAARLWPLWSDLPALSALVVAAGSLTFLLGAVMALQVTDLKALLAYTTIAQLGLLLSQYGLTEGARPEAELLHLGAHSLYKASLFLAVGVIDHAFGSRDLKTTGGVLRRYPALGAAMAVALASMVGLPGTLGFLSKELMLTVSFDALTAAPAWENAWWLHLGQLSCLVLGSTLYGVVALRVARRVLSGAPPSAAAHHPPSAVLIGVPVLLSLSSLVLGVAPALVNRGLAALGDLTSGAAVTTPTLALWHGLTPALGLSLGIWCAAAALAFTLDRRALPQRGLPAALQPGALLSALLRALPRATSALHRAVGLDRPVRFLAAVTGALTLAWVIAALSQPEALLAHLGRLEPTPHAVDGFARVPLALMIGGGALCAAVWRAPIRQLFAVSVVGLGVACYYVLYRAPDLALTQLLVEAATLLLVLPVLLRLRRVAPAPGALAAGAPKRRLMIALGFGLCTGLSVLLFQQTGAERAGDFYLEQTVPLARGANAVNTVVVDFRGFDTMLEITVLVIAGLGCLGLLTRRRNTKGSTSDDMTSANLPNSDGEPNWSPIPVDLIVRGVAFGGLVPLNLFSLYIFFRGHNAAGGGFVAGLITALSLILLAFALGVEKFRTAIRAAPLRVAAFGVGLALLTAIVPTLLGRSLLHHLHGELLGVAVNTPMLFDLGVFFAVVGVTLELTLPLLRSLSGRAAFTRDRAALSPPGHEAIEAGASDAAHSMAPSDGEAP
ncbi:MAG: DUF4040 domain-containing protein [Polyangiaceae bacterium]|nr:DUF4040 domain-containing protein [Polyangiaceae bacterium]MCW5789467.1 DUF4040 domain-containing protein [Polyangiaceae bacterium]